MLMGFEICGESSELQIDAVLLPIRVHITLRVMRGINSTVIALGTETTSQTLFSGRKRRNANHRVVPYPVFLHSAASVVENN
jgi:hypothetical protein